MTDEPTGEPAGKPTPSPYPEDVSRFVERFASELTDAGMTRMSARVFAALLASESGALNSAELGERLHISPAAVSGAVRYLTQLGLIGREREPGSRRERYRVHSDQWYETYSRRNQVLTRWVDTMRTGVEALGEDTAAGQRIDETLAFFEFLHAESAAMMDRWTVRRARLREQGRLARGEGGEGGEDGGGERNGTGPGDGPER
ncbi:GbsR/MarR family transcriptional regulator [Streptomyces sp. Ru87]|uniref:GbsR/MarR family transcriptional regulator n=1 Tax=Streptomyces sp. Ru87 TaxID=2044307 RepID=UPI0027BB0204|nr:helix-turn-helix domain-containing protein [Streptomyces sp. Ru87]